MLFKLGGTGGHPFYSTLQLSRFFRCSVGFTSGGCGVIFLCGKNGCLNRTGLPQASSLRSIGKAATSVLPPFTRCVSSSKVNVPLTQVALVARPCAPAAQRADDSSSSSRRLAISLCLLTQPLEIEQDCSFRMPREKMKMPW